MLIGTGRTFIDIGGSRVPACPIALRRADQKDRAADQGDRSEDSACFDPGRSGSEFFEQRGQFSGKSAAGAAALPGDSIVRPV